MAVDWRWRDYPQAEGAHPTRPWWRLDDEWWRRNDGRPMAVQRIGGAQSLGLFDDRTDAELAHRDRTCPMRVPPPRVGQVWRSVFNSGMLDLMIGEVDGGDKGDVYWATDEHCPIGEWPPACRVLIAGPGAPWAPPELVE